MDNYHLNNTTKLKGKKLKQCHFEPIESFQKKLGLLENFETIFLQVDAHKENFIKYQNYSVHGHKVLITYG